MNQPNKPAHCNPCTDNSGFFRGQSCQVPCATMNFNNSTPTCCTCHPSSVQYFNGQNQESSVSFPQNRNHHPNPCNVPSSSNGSNLLIRRALSSGCQNERDISPANDVTTRTCDQDAPALLTDVQRSMTDTYRRIQSQYLSKEQEIQTFRQRWEDVSLVNDKLKKEITQLKRERTISAKEVEKMKTRIEAEEQRTQENLALITQQRNELATQKEKVDSQSNQIRLLEERNKELETKHSELFSNHVDQTVETLLAQHDKANLSGNIASLKRNLQAHELKIKNITKKCCDLIREKEKLQNSVKLQEVELKAEKLLKEQILADEMSILLKPTLLNTFITQNKTEFEPARALMRNLASNDRADMSRESRRQEVLMVTQETLRLNGTSHIIQKTEEPTALKQRYDHLISEIGELKQHLRLVDEAQKRKLCSVASSSSIAEKKQKINSDQRSLAISEFSESGLGEDESATDDDVIDPDLILLDDELTTGGDSMFSQSTQTQIDDLVILEQESSSVSADERSGHQDLAS